MSNVGQFESIYVGDLGGYISIDSINAWNERETEADELARQYERLGPIELLAGKSLAPFQFSRHNVTVTEWEFELYRARRYLRGLRSWRTLEPLLIRQLLTVGRAYAIRRYAREEQISFPSAMTAALPYGMQALISQFLSRQGLAISSAQSHKLSSAWKATSEADDLTAYGKTGRVRGELFALVDQICGPYASTVLPREETRQILSLTRLHFSVAEMNNGGFARFARLESLYIAERKKFLEKELSPTFTGIRNWQQRHLRPLLFYYPFALRQAVARGRKQVEMPEEPRLPERVANEVALAHCALSHMPRRVGR